MTHCTNIYPSLAFPSRHNADEMQVERWTELLAAFGFEGGSGLIDIAIRYIRIEVMLILILILILPGLDFNLRAKDIFVD